MTDTPPDWVIREAARKCGTPTNEANYWHMYDKAFKALCDMIAKYEQPPIDRKLLCARTAVTSGDAHWTPEQMAVRAIELWIEGFGK